MCTGHIRGHYSDIYECSQKWIREKLSTLGIAAPKLGRQEYGIWGDHQWSEGLGWGETPCLCPVPPGQHLFGLTFGRQSLATKPDSDRTCKPRALRVGIYQTDLSGKWVSTCLNKRRFPFQRIETKSDQSFEGMRDGMGGQEKADYLGENSKVFGDRKRLTKSLKFSRLRQLIGC